MKRTIHYKLLLALVLAFSLTACGGTTKNTSSGLDSLLGRHSLPAGGFDEADKPDNTNPANDADETESMAEPEGPAEPEEPSIGNFIPNLLHPNVPDLTGLLEEDERNWEAAGVYDLISITTASQTMDTDDLTVMAESAGVTKDCSLTLDPGGDYALNMFGLEYQEGTWAEKDGTVILTTDGGSIFGRLSDGRLTLMDESGTTSMTFAMRESKAVGLYDLKSITAEDQTLDMEDLKSAADDAGVEMDIGLELKSDGKYELKMVGPNGAETQEGTWDEKDGTVTLTTDGESISGRLEGNELTVSDESGTISMTFEKK